MRYPGGEREEISYMTLLGCMSCMEECTPIKVLCVCVCVCVTDSMSGSPCIFVVL